MQFNKLMSHLEHAKTSKKNPHPLPPPVVTQYKSPLFHPTQLLWTKTTFRQKNYEQDTEIVLLRQVWKFKNITILKGNLTGIPTNWLVFSTNGDSWKLAYHRSSVSVDNRKNIQQTQVDLVSVIYLMSDYVKNLLMPC